jgi:hypothetical protein
MVDTEIRVTDPKNMSRFRLSPSSAFKNAEGTVFGIVRG